MQRLPVGLLRKGALPPRLADATAPPLSSSGGLTPAARWRDRSPAASRARFACVVPQLFHPLGDDGVVDAELLLREGGL
jgi:hypothetical protein